MEPDIVYFDLETQRSFNDVGGDKTRMGVSIAVTYSTRLREYRIYSENQLDHLVSQLQSAALVVGHNHVEFDYPVLQQYTILDLPALTLNLDTMLDLQHRTGRRFKLDALAKGSLGLGKTAVGTDALHWWRQHQQTGDPKPLMDIAEYCAYDVKVTKAVHEYGQTHGHVRIAADNGQINEIEVDW